MWCRQLSHSHEKWYSGKVSMMHGTEINVLGYEWWSWLQICTHPWRSLDNLGLSLVLRIKCGGRFLYLPCCTLWSKGGIQTLYNHSVHVTGVENLLREHFSCPRLWICILGYLLNLQKILIFVAITLRYFYEMTDLSGNQAAYVIMELKEQLWSEHTSVCGLSAFKMDWLPWKWEQAWTKHNKDDLENKWVNENETEACVTSRLRSHNDLCLAFWRRKI